MAKKIRIMLVDDSAVIRRLLTDILTSDPQLDVAGSAQNGQVALEKLPILNPDLIVLDVEMPVMDGLETLTEIRKRQPRLPIIMFSSITERGAVVTLEALARGANDYITKPANTGNMGKSLQRVRDELIPRIKAFCQHLLSPPVPAFPASRPLATQSPVSPETVAPLPAPPPPPINPPPLRRPAAGLHPHPRVDVVAIGVSTGGPNALAALLSRLPAPFPAPIVIVQHMPPIFTRLLAERLATQTALPIAEGAAGEILQAGQIRLAPGGSHMVLERQGSRVYLQLNQDEPENSCRPAVDVLFRSVAAVYRSNTLAVVLTGMGQDGLRGCEVIRNAGGQILVQDEASSVVWGMPGFVAKAGLADGQIALPQMAREILSRVRINR
ncbi:MAG: chemotaxis response regulator protein-glutamate methylesterase [Candidatus Competibacteraceae bacterium]|nr:chemotaxis response regulator protein-glutamate methylesterase [Candidatus Competibacteraceae bacterium]